MTAVGGGRASQAAFLAVGGALAASVGVGLMAFDAIVSGFEFPFDPPVWLGAGGGVALVLGALIVRHFPRVAQALWVVAIVAMAVGQILAYALACILAVAAIVQAGGVRLSIGELRARGSRDRRGEIDAASPPTHRFPVLLAWLGVAVGVVFYVPTAGVFLEYGLGYPFLVTSSLETLGLALSIVAAVAMGRHTRWAPAAAIVAALLLAALNWTQAIASALLIAAAITTLRSRPAGPAVDGGAVAAQPGPRD